MSKTTEFSATVSATTRNGVLVVTIDNPPVNATSVDVRSGLEKALAHSETAPDVIGVVVTGAGKTFIGGADIKEFGKPATEPTLPDVIETIECLSKPVVSALNGAALGGGLEVVLACHYRIASPAAQVGLPEVKLGIVPGAGGTQRLPRLIGIPAALDLITSGRSVKADEALKLGIIDEVAAGDLVEAAISSALALAGKPLRRTGDLDVAAADPVEIEKASVKILARARGQKAPAEAVRLVISSNRPLAEGLADERATFLALRDSREAAALRHVFFAERESSKVEGLEGVEPRPVKTIGICGLGLMGSGIAVAALGAGYSVIGLDQTVEAAEKGRERIVGLLERNLASGRLDQAGFEAQKARLSVTAEDVDLAPCDLVVEAVFDDLAVKTDLFQRLDKVIRPDAVLATNTSYLNPDEIAAATAHPERVLGLHFFSPAHVMRLLEVVRCAKTAPDVLATGLAVAKKLRKLPVVTGVTEGFIGNRIFSAYRREAEFLLEDGALPHEIDAALEDYGFPMGLFAVYDMAGLEIAWARRKRQAATRDPSARYVEIADTLCEAGRLGQKAGRGWYAYPDGKRTIDPEVTAIIEAARAKRGVTPRAFSKSEILERMLGAMACEGEALLAERVAARASDIDLVMINGYGFPAHKGGPMFARA
ncbi:3-hydroxyacyl-CoA dehydrogenase NAD-binding domain-containing protein [Neorhizobium galegae]|uniref:3-hydroxyacyl-CoA dehydrogenase NAD-binding domain-containing protein n=1 Tax=Neorhizobium galegae TaxID=399 RepID=UPI000621A368|nr:3-hydroxyacyl-CoA dehydrogenase NAD-binding domain-containing protein [Neorhizobium galegae]CDZ29670.1 Enoyl-CoA hydratase/isomerase/3-hydroxyacyl-CoA dehydrogenase [Neorhizobium galegae bv. officinalis]KAA9385167.1 3-hydroxyacyl-CoA dehydrogenase [Neorhizobium galegae]KAB1110495.1 3-hydroxyacyl-CoA dehydrogenase [Neorhizobium galegae]MCM2499803.1 3-hydroxyacyl-CoA dehydrogenase NAD-binding domain-containing protein [Neorhizobium galegae]MCQ1773536.1 3-hydroxyacyl-CoA dehydrogenase NAD-bind